MFFRNEIRDDKSVSFRVCHPWWELEEYRPDGGMWAIPGSEDRQTFIDSSAQLMMEPDKFKAAMLRAVEEWPKSCEVALTTPGLNKRAWMGHAGCYLGTSSPEETTRLGWHQLNDIHQWAANQAADEAIAHWGVTRPAAVVQLDLFGHA